MTDLWESDQGPALFMDAATKQMMTKTTTTATSPLEELLLTKLQEQGFTTENRGPDKTNRVEGVASEERGALSTRAGQHKVLTQAGVQVSAHTTPSVVEIDGQFFLTRCR